RTLPQARRRRLGPRPAKKLRHPLRRTAAIVNDSGHFHAPSLAPFVLLSGSHVAHLVRGPTLMTARRPRLLLVTAPYHSGVVAGAGVWLPLHYVYLAGEARRAGAEVRIY